MIDFAWFFKIIWKTDWVCLEGDWQHQTQQPIIRISKPQQLVVMHVLNSFERESLYRFCALTVSFVEAGRIARPALGWSSFLHNKRTVHSSLVFAERFSAKMKNEESCKPLEIYVYIYIYTLYFDKTRPLTAHRSRTWHMPGFVGWTAAKLKISRAWQELEREVSLCMALGVASHRLESCFTREMWSWLQGAAPDKGAEHQPECLCK